MAIGSSATGALGPVSRAANDEETREFTWFGKWSIHRRTITTDPDTQWRIYIVLPAYRRYIGYCATIPAVIRAGT